MTVLRKWNPAIHKYEPYEIPDDWHPSTFELDMSNIVTCPQCGIEISYGATYTSQEIHTEFGFGYGVCPDCHQEEMKRRLYEYTDEDYD